jgi:hypothetical protein
MSLGEYGIGHVMLKLGLQGSELHLATDHVVSTLPVHEQANSINDR